MRTRLIIVRHGESASNVQHVIAGHLDVPLTALGEDQARQTAAHLASEPIEAVYSSNNKAKVNRYSKEGLLEMLEHFFKGKDLSPKATFADTEYLMDVYSGRFGIAHGKNDSIIRILVNK